MKISNWVSVLSILFSLPLSAQIETTYHSVYFAFDEYTITPEEAIKIDSVLRLTTGKLLTITVVGHTDSIGSQTYNWQLSEKRVLNTRALLLEKGISPNLILMAYEGETKPAVGNQSETGRQLNRRVELWITYLLSPLEEPGPPSVHVEESTSTDILPPPLKGDTVLLMDGVRIVLSKADFDKFEDCLRIRPVLSGTDARELDLTTITTQNDLLVSCGMIDLQLDPPCTGCFDKPIKVQFPVNVASECDVCRQRRVYDVAEGNRWSERSD
ncbi:MAG: OmpA family protein, partial [Bacteroidota bacterium]